MYGKHIRVEMKATLNEMKNPQGTNSEGKEAEVQINDLEHKGEISSQPEQNEETRIQKSEERIRRLAHFQECQHLNHMDARRRRGRARN